MTIALLCPTRARHDKLCRMISSVKATSDDVKFYITFSEEDKKNYPLTLQTISTPDGMPTCFKWNLLAEEAMKDPENKLFMLAADDIIFSTPMWDRALLDHYNTLENKIHVYALRDSRDENGTPHPIVTREWIEAMGWFVPPIFLHWIIDTWSVEIAKSNGVFTHLKNYMLIHDKCNDRGEPDETHTRIRANGWHSRDMWVAEHSQDILEMYKGRLAKCISHSHKNI